MTDKVLDMACHNNITPLLEVSATTIKTNLRSFSRKTAVWRDGPFKTVSHGFVHPLSSAVCEALDRLPTDISIL